LPFDYVVKQRAMFFKGQLFLFNPIRKARRAKFLAEYWGVKHGGRGANQYAGKNSEMLKKKNSPLATPGLQFKNFAILAK